MVKRAYTSANGANRGPFAKKARISKPLRSAITTASRQAVIRLAEHKEYLAQVDEVGVSTIVQGADWSHISDVVSGDRYRTGKEIHLQSVRCRGVLHNNASGTNLVRMVVGYVEDELTPSNISDYFLSGTTTGGTIAPVSFTNVAAAGLNSMYQPMNKSKITLLYDRVFKLGANASVDGAQVQPYDFTLSLKSAKIKYEGNSTGAGNQNRMLYIGCWAAEGGDDTGLGTVVEWSGMTQLKYIDI